MAKKVVRKSVSRQKISARPLGVLALKTRPEVNSRGEPLGFWNFIRKNFLIIAGLLLLPVTVGAVLSSYGTFSGSSSAVNTINTQDINTLSEVTCLVEKIVGRDRIYIEGQVDCRGWPRANICEVCQSGNMESCTQPNQFAVCDMTPPPAGDSCSSPSTPNQQYVCVPAAKLCNFCNNGQWRECDEREKQEQCNISIPTSVPSPTVVASTAPRLPTQAQPTDKPNQPTQTINKCDKEGYPYDQAGCGQLNCQPNEKMKCKYTDDGTNTGTCTGKECHCEADASCPGGQGGNPQPTTGGGGEPPSGGGRNEDGKICTFCPNGGVCHKCGGGSCSDGSTYNGDDCAPQESCSKRAEDACHLRGPDIKPAGFNFQKAVKNFFGNFFGF